MCNVNNQINLHFYLDFFFDIDLFSFFFCEKLPELQIRGDIEDNSKIIFLIFNENILCDPSLESS